MQFITVCSTSYAKIYFYFFIIFCFYFLRKSDVNEISVTYIVNPRNFGRSVCAREYSVIVECFVYNIIFVDVGRFTPLAFVVIRFEPRLIAVHIQKNVRRLFFRKNEFYVIGDVVSRFGRYERKTFDITVGVGEFRRVESKYCCFISARRSNDARRICFFGIGKSISGSGAGNTNRKFYLNFGEVLCLIRFIQSDVCGSSTARPHHQSFTLCVSEYAGGSKSIVLVDIAGSRCLNGSIRPRADFRAAYFEPGLSSVHIEHDVFGRFVVYFFKSVRAGDGSAECKCRKAHAQCKQKSDNCAFLVQKFAFYHVSSCVPYFSCRNVSTFKSFSLAKQEKRGTPFTKSVASLYASTNFTLIVLFSRLVFNIL